MRTLSTLLAALLIVSALPAIALAQEPAPEIETPSETGDAVERIIGNLKDRAENAIEKRLDTIKRVDGALQEAEHLTDAHEGVLLDELSLSAAGLTTLGREIEAADTLAELWDLIPKIFEDYRIYAVVVPKAHLVAVADTIVAGTGRAVVGGEALQEAIDRVGEAGYDTLEAEEALAEMVASIRQSSALADPVPDTVLPLEPSDWPVPAQGVIDGAHAGLRAARDQLASAVRSAHEVARILRDLVREG
jgi:hypothetical protein